MRMPATFAAGIRKGKPMRAGLENELRAELNRARIAHGRNLAVLSRRDRGGRGAEVSVIENVEGFAAKLNLLAAFTNANVLED